jgi:hypothetical protein
LPSTTNVVAGNVREITYVGAFRHYRVGLSNEHELIVYQQSSGTPALQEGRSVKVAWEPSAGSFQPGEHAP